MDTGYGYGNVASIDGIRYGLGFRNGSGMSSDFDLLIYYVK